MKICGEEGDGRVKKFFAVYLVKNARKSDFWGDWWYDGIVRMADLSWINRNMGCIEINLLHPQTAPHFGLIETWDVLKSKGAGHPNQVWKRLIETWDVLKFSSLLSLELCICD